MANQINLEQIKKLTEEFFDKMTIERYALNVQSEVPKNTDSLAGNESEEKNIITIEVELEEPQILIGQQGQTLFELQRILRIILNKQLKEVFYLNLDINAYKKNKIEYLESLAQKLAEEVVLEKHEKELPPMNSYERRIIHAKLAGKDDIITESRGEGLDRHLVIKPK